jgi:hypothetical protein
MDGEAEVPSEVGSPQTQRIPQILSRLSELRESDWVPNPETMTVAELHRLLLEIRQLDAMAGGSGITDRLGWQDRDRYNRRIRALYRATGFEDLRAHLYSKFALHVTPESIEWVRRRLARKLGCGPDPAGARTLVEAVQDLADLPVPSDLPPPTEPHAADAAAANDGAVSNPAAQPSASDVRRNDGEWNEAQVSKYLKTHPKASARVVAEKTGVARGSVCKTNAWRNHMAARRAGRTGGGRPSHTVPLTGPMMATRAAPGPDPSEAAADQEDLAGRALIENGDPEARAKHHEDKRRESELRKLEMEQREDAKHGN